MTMILLVAGRGRNLRPARCMPALECFKAWPQWCLLDLKIAGKVLLLAHLVKVMLAFPPECVEFEVGQSGQILGAWVPLLWKQKHGSRQSSLKFLLIKVTQVQLVINI